MITDDLMRPLKAVALTGVTTTMAKIGTALDLAEPRNHGLIAKPYGSGFVLTVKGGAATEATALELELVTSDADTLTTPTVLVTIPAISSAAAAAGYQTLIEMPNSDAYKKYLGVRAKAAKPFSAGTVSLSYVADGRNWRAYPAHTGR